MKTLKISEDNKKTWIYSIVSTLDPAISQTVRKGTDDDIRNIIAAALLHAQGTDAENLIQGITSLKDVKKTGKMYTAKIEFRDYVVIATATEIELERAYEIGDRDIEPEL